MPTLVSNRVVLPSGERPAAIVIEGEKIAKICGREDLPADADVIDVGDRVISPGVIDAHVHVNEPGRTEWEGFASATVAAAAGGVTTIIDMPLNSSPVTTTSGALATKRSSAQGKCRVDVGCYAGLVPGNERLLPEMIDDGVLGVKAFLCDSGLDDFPASGERELRAALSQLSHSQIPLLAHAEIVDDTLSLRVTDPKSYQQYAASRPPEFERAAVRLLIDLCGEYQTPIQIVHLADAGCLPMIRAAKAAGLPLTVETCPHYLFFQFGSDCRWGDGMEMCSADSRCG